MQSTRDNRIPQTAPAASAPARGYPEQGGGAKKSELRGMSFADGEKALAPAGLGVDESPYADTIAAWEKQAAGHAGPSGQDLIKAGDGGPGVAWQAPNAKSVADKLRPDLEAERRKVAQELADLDAMRPRIEGGILDAEIEAAEEQRAVAAKKSNTPAWALEETVVVEELRAKKAALEKKEKAAKDKLDELEADLAAVDSAGTDPATLNRILARRGTTASTEREVDTIQIDGDGGMGPGAGRGMATASALTETASNLVDGAAVTRTKSASYNVGMRGLEVTEGDETEIVAGDHRSKEGTRTTTWGMPLGGGRSRTRLKETSDGQVESKEESNDETSFTPWGGFTKAKSDKKSMKKGDYTASSASSDTSNVGLGGWTRKQRNTEQVGDHVIKNDSDTGVTRGDGNIGVGKESTRVNGTVDETGALTKGNATTKKAEAHVTMTKDKAALGGSADAERKTAYGNGKTTRVSGHCDGHVAVSMEPDPDAPGMFVLVVSMHGSASLGGGAGKEGGNKAKGSASGGVKVKGSIDRTWTHKLTEAECEAYRQSLNGLGPGGSGAWPELAVIGQAWRSGWNDGAADAIAAMEADPEYIKTMKDGDSIETKVNLGAEGDVELGGSAGAFGAKLKGGVSVETDISNKFTANGNNTDMEAEVDTKTGYAAGAELTFEGVSLGADFGSKDISGHGIALSVPKGDPNYATIMTRVKACKSEADVQALLRDYKQLKPQATALTGKEKTEKVTIGFAKAKVTMGDTHGHTKKVTTDAEGNVTNQHFEGHQTSSQELSWDDKYKIGSSDTNKLVIDVDKDGNMSGDLSHSRRESDLTGTLMAATDKPEGSVISKATGANKTEVQETEISEGMFLKTSDFERIMGEASDPKEWKKRGVQDQDGWADLGRAIRSANGDKAKVAEALTKFMDSNESAHREMLEIVIRPLGAVNGGSAYQFPSSIAHLKGTYSALIDRDPTRAIEELAKTDKAASVEKARALYDQVVSLEVSINSAHSLGKFTDEGRFGEMMSRISTRKGKLTKLMGLGERGQDLTRFNGLITTCSGHKQAEDAAYAKMMGNFDGNRETDAYANVATQNQLRQLYPRFQKDWNDLSFVANKWNMPRDRWAQYAPTPERLKRYESGKAPEANTADEDNREEARRVEANRQSDQAWGNNPYHLQAKAQARQNEVQDERKKAVAVQRPRVNGAKAAAQNAAGWMNYANSQGKAVSPEAQALGGQGFTKMALLNQENDNFEMVCRSPEATVQAVVTQADRRIARWMEIKDLFDRGKAANRI